MYDAPAPATGVPFAKGAKHRRRRVVHSPCPRVEYTLERARNPNARQIMAGPAAASAEDMHMMRLERQVDDLQLELAMATSQLEETTSSKEQLKKALLGEQRKSEATDALREEVARASAMVRQAQTHAHEMARRADNAELQLGELASALEQERVSKAALERTAAASRAPAAAAATTKAALEREASASRTAAAAATAAVVESEERIRRLSADRDAYRDQVRTLGIQQRRTEQALAAAEAQAAKATAAMREEATRREAAERAREAATREAAKERALKATADAALAKAAKEMGVATEAARQLEAAAEEEAASLRAVALAAEADAKEAREKLAEARAMKVEARERRTEAIAPAAAAQPAAPPAAPPSPAKRGRSTLVIATLVLLCGGSLWWAQTSGAAMTPTARVQYLPPPATFGDGNDSSAVWGPAEADASPPPPPMLASPLYKAKFEDDPSPPSPAAGSSWLVWSLWTLLSLGGTAAYVYLQRDEKTTHGGGDDAPDQHTEDVQTQQASPASSSGSQEDWAVINDAPTA